MNSPKYAQKIANSWPACESLSGTPAKPPRMVRTRILLVWQAALASPSPWSPAPTSPFGAPPPAPRSILGDRRGPCCGGESHRRRDRDRRRRRHHAQLSHLSFDLLHPPGQRLSSDQQLDCALDLMRRLPPQQIEKNLSDLIDLESIVGAASQEADVASISTVQHHPTNTGGPASTIRGTVAHTAQPCPEERRPHGRSPWSNKYDPPLEDGAMPSARLRKLEVEANNAFDQYRDLYFEGGVSSVYLWDLDHGFAGVILIKKAGDGSKKIKGCWDSIHVVEVQEKSSGRTAHYKLTSTVMLWLQTNKSGSGTMNLGGSLTRQKMVCQLAEKGVAGGGCRAVHKKTGDKGLDRATQEGCRDKPVVRTLAKPVSAHSRRSQDSWLPRATAAWSSPGDRLYVDSQCELLSARPRAGHLVTPSSLQWAGLGPSPQTGRSAGPMEKDETVSDCSPHIANIGRLVEDMENKIRSTLNEIYFGKTKDIVNGLRSVDAIPDNQKFQQLQRELSQVLTQRQIYIQPDN
ncbi:F-actin-capping protein subunit beta [Tupaia chinensis]|uniref:CapZ beta n=1 Tax=Tupaia chinensis TaxID=246437 RepID=L9L030_TUPCH|nr:F-actin-capping protein subunit beta [Tupaia chinensis]